MKNKIKKILIIWLVSLILLENIAQGQVSSVPVSDAGVKARLQNILDGLDVITTQIQAFLDPLNVNVKRILERMNEQEITNQSNDFLSNYEAIRQFQIYENALKTLKEETDNYKKQALEEAKIAGAYEALKEVSQKITCINPKIRKELNAALKNIFLPYRLSNRAIIGYFNKIPDCYTSESTTESAILKPKLSFFAFLQPFIIKPFLAQIGTGNESQNSLNSTFSITPAYQDTTNLMESNELVNLIRFTVNNRVSEKLKEREAQIGEIRPLHEECIEKINIDNVTDDLFVFCKKYKTIVTGKDIENLVIKSNLDNNNNLKFRSATTYLTSTPKVSTIKISFKNLREDVCGNYKQDAETFGHLSAFAICLQDLARTILTPQLVINDGTKRLKRAIEVTITENERLNNRIDEILRKLPNQCSEAKKYLESTKNYLGQDKELLVNFNASLGDLITLLGGNTDKIINTITEITNVVIMIEDTVKKIKNLITDVTKVLYKSGVFLDFGELLGINISAIAKILSQLAQTLEMIVKSNELITFVELYKEIRDGLIDITTNVDSIIKTFDENFDGLDKFLAQLNDFFYKVDSLIIIRRVSYDYPLIDAKLDIYEELAKMDLRNLQEMGICVEEEKILVVDSNNERFTKSTGTNFQTVINQQPKQNFNLFSYLKNFFKPKIVEIK